MAAKVTRWKTGTAAVWVMTGVSVGRVEFIGKVIVGTAGGGCDVEIATNETTRKGHVRGKRRISQYRF
jgi:hypothetical protein